jgi:predicted nucleotidyltransferase
LRLFGSGVREGWDPAKSDIDFLAEIGEPPPGINLFTQFFRFMVELEEAVGLRIDLVDWKAVTKQHFKEAAEAEAQEWYAA